MRVSARSSAIRSLFHQHRDRRLRLVLLGVLALTLMVIDHRSDWLADVRWRLEWALSPLTSLATLPTQWQRSLKLAWVERLQWQAEVAELRQQVLELTAEQQRLRQLDSENQRLRKLLDSRERVQQPVMATEIIGVDNDPYRHEVIIDKGTRAGARIGQVLLDGNGILGQVVWAGPDRSRVLLISDVTHGIPVVVVRSGVRAIAVGSGMLQRLNLIHVPDSADIVVGDEVVSSGLGDRFPPGYPVARVTTIEHLPGAAFATVAGEPAAALDRTRLGLLVLTNEAQAESIAK